MTKLRQLSGILFILTGMSFFESAHAAEQQFALQKHGGGTVYVDLVVGNIVRAPFLVDTGSSLVTLNNDTFTQLQRKGQIERIGFIAARMANGAIQKVQQYRVQSISIDARCELGPADIAVVPSGSNILGINALLKAAPITLTADNLGLAGCHNLKI